MRYQILATDYDGTIAHNGIVDASTVVALKNLLATGRHASRRVNQLYADHRTPVSAVDRRSGAAQYAAGNRP